ncbi:dynamin family protein [Acaryochloris sp. IP29b_bin.137]|uniref:dynamin family protein n=1 Tax=Acaryochloris sp. IP29b_bin.137 TaxID=2969217 RepID=UPI002605D793|nr:dynamin family protein [Acaryochloris sp. IP29b_bin.137]
MMVRSEPAISESSPFNRQSMSNSVNLPQAAGYLDDFDQVRRVREQVAEHLERIVQILTQSEMDGAQASGQLGLDRQITLVQMASDHLKQGIFRLVVLGDLKRGKSTLINAILGERLLPSDVNPCTAILSVLKYGPQKRVTIYFRDDTPPQQIDVATFKWKYTIDPSEAKALEEKDEQAFPNVSHAVIEYPLPLLSKGIELVDTPGLNDTEARNELVLNYLNDCHAVLFVLNTTQPCTLDERRYLRNFLQNRGLTIFFLLNAWDKVQNSLLDPDDKIALAEAETKLRQVFQTHLSPYCLVNGEDRYQQRVFEISALPALRSQLHDPKALLDDTGIPAFLDSLTQFLTRERTSAELNHAAQQARAVAAHVHEAVERRIPLLGEDIGNLKDKVASVQAEFDQLTAVSTDFQTEIRKIRDREAQAIADSFQTYLLQLEKTFETDFVVSQPDLEFLDFLNKQNRAKFHESFKRAFERYLTDQLADWEMQATQQLETAFAQVQAVADQYRGTYTQVVDVINAKLLGRSYGASGHPYNATETWTDTVFEVLDAIPNSLNGVVGRLSPFWRRVMQAVFTSLCVTLVIQIVGLLFSAMALNVFLVIAAGAGLVAGQAEYVRQTFLTTTRQEFAKCLPQIAQEQHQAVYEAVESCFNTYETEIIQRLNDDISARQTELTHLVTQKETQDIQLEQETERLQQLDQRVAEQVTHLTALL